MMGQMRQRVVGPLGRHSAAFMAELAKLVLSDAKWMGIRLPVVDLQQRGAEMRRETDKLMGIPKAQVRSSMRKGTGRI